MRYLGGKSRAAKHIVRKIVDMSDDRTRWVEPFLGGGSVAEEAARHFPTLTLSDVHPDLILMWQRAQSGWIPPTTITEKDYWLYKDSEIPTATRGFVGFASSFGAKWFGGYARGESRNFADEGSRSVQRTGRALADALIVRRSYELADEDVTADTVVYCDPPYESTTSYGGTLAFDHDRFWCTTREWASRGALVFVSEYSCDDAIAEEVWSRPQTDGLRKRGGTTQSTERLFLVKPYDSERTEAA